MNWGDLGHFPFWSTVWGTAAEWCGAIATGGAAIAAAWFYIADRYRESTAQSRAVNYLQQGGSYIVTNASDQPIYQVRLLYDPPKSFGAALASNSNIYGVKHWNRNEEPYKHWTDQAIYNSYQQVQQYRWHDKWDKIGPGETESCPTVGNVGVLISVQPYLAFVDVRGRDWDLYLGEEKPKKHNKGKTKLRNQLAVYRITRTNRLRARWRAMNIAKNVDKTSRSD